MFLCFLWVVLLSVVLFAQWDLMNHTERQFLSSSSRKSQQFGLPCCRFFNFCHAGDRWYHSHNTSSSVRRPI